MTTIVLNPSTSTAVSGANATVYSTESARVGKGPSAAPRIKQKIDTESAVFAHIQALRALGITHTDSQQIARSLGLGQSDVEKTISSLVKRGVKVVNG